MRRDDMRCFPFVVLLPVVLSAQDAELDALRATLASIRAHSAKPPIDNRGARSELTTAKHQLRDWIESQLNSSKDILQTDEFSQRINRVLQAAKLTESEDGQNLVGSLGRIGLHNEWGLLIVTTAVGILCGYDESAYIYKSRNGRWQRIWESEQDDYSPNRYAPQQFDAVHAWHSPGDHDINEPFYVLTLAYEGWCSSTWHSVYYRVWRIDPNGSKLLIDRSEFAWLRTEAYIVGSIGRAWEDNAPVDVLIEFTERSIDGGVHNREAVRHFLIDGDEVKRADPLALSPRDFVDEWLTRPWTESATWSASPALRTWYRKFQADFVTGNFVDATRHCQTPDLWQVGFQSESTAYFLIRWHPPYRFTMVAISDKPWPRCTEEDPAADEWRTLFSTQEWRW